MLRVGWAFRLKLLAEELENHVADEGGDVRNDEVWDRQDVVDREPESTTGAIGASELAHQEIRVEEEDDEPDLD